MSLNSKISLCIQPGIESNFHSWSKSFVETLHNTFSADKNMFNFDKNEKAKYLKLGVINEGGDFNIKLGV